MEMGAPWLCALPRGTWKFPSPGDSGQHRPSISLTCPLKHPPYPPAPQGPTLNFPRATSFEAA